MYVCANMYMYLNIYLYVKLTYLTTFNVQTFRSRGGGEGAEGVLVGTQKATVGTQASKQKRRSEETEIY